MNLAYNYQLIPDDGKKREMEDFIDSTYWENDAWHIFNPFFDKYRTIFFKSRVRTVDFSELPDLLRLEYKYFLATRITERKMQLSTLFTDYQFAMKIFSVFLREMHPDLRSFAEIQIEEMTPQWMAYAKDNGKRESRTAYKAQIYQPYLFFSRFYDTRDEYEKDIWDCHKLPGVNIPLNVMNYLINFTKVPAAFRKLAQRYIKLRLTTNSASFCRLELDSISHFFQYIASAEPQWEDLKALTRRHIEDFLSHYFNLVDFQKQRSVDRLIHIKHFLERIQQFDYPDAPVISAPSLLFYEDFPRRPTLSPMSDRVKYIPEGVIFQLKENLEHLTPSEYIPVVILLMATGWRISDILSLRYDACLEHTAQGWYLRGDIQKTRVIEHRVPITDEVRSVVQSVAEIAKTKSTRENNPLRLLFNRYSGKRIGKPPDNKRISEALNRLAKKFNITDDQGNVYYFRTHAFRHTKGVELINNGMSLVHVQKWMAHMSPEMTLVYAKVLDTTLRKSWEQAVKNGIFRIDHSGHIKKVDIADIESEDLIEWEYIRHNLDAVRMPLGFCMKPKKQDCFTQLNPCLTCRNLCTTPDFLPQYELEVRETKTLIERGKAQGREIWVEKNQHLLERYEEIIAILKTGKTRHIAGKKGREYVREERDNAK